MEYNNFETALEYMQLGLTPIPLHEKIPILKNPYSRPLTLQELEKYFYKTKNNIGVCCGIISNNLFVTDLDDRAIAKKWKNSLNHILVKAPIVDTARGYHIWIKIKESLENIKFKKYPKIDLKYNGHVVAPFSIHNTGIQYLFQTPLDSIPEFSLKDLPFEYEIIENIQLNNNQKKPFICDVRPHGIPYRLFKSLKGEQDRYDSRSEHEYALIVNLVKDGWNFEQIYSLFEIHAKENTHYREKNDYRHRWLKNSFDKASQYLSSNVRDIDTVINGLYAYADNPFNFPGRAGHTDRAVFLSIINIARRTGRIKGIGASTREIAEMAGINRLTADKSLKRISELEKVQNEFCKNGFSIYPNIFNIKIEIISYDVKPTHIEGFVDHDLFRHRGLGKTGLQLFKCFIENPDKELNFSELVQKTNLNKMTVSRKIKLMVSLKIIEKNLTAYKFIKNCSLDEAASMLGTYGKKEKQHSIHREERKIFNKGKRGKL